MGKFKKALQKKISALINRMLGSGLVQDENTADGTRYVTEGMPELIRKSGAESIVLLENDGVLPLKESDVISVFGRCQFDWFYVGYGSGGDVHPPYKVNLIDGLKTANVKINETLCEKYKTWSENPDNEADHGYWGHWPYNFPEMPINVNEVEAAAKLSNVALVVIGRAAGEDRENVLKEGSYYLTAEEKSILEKVTKAFKKTVVILDCGNIIDLSWVREYKVNALLYAWQLGQESGNAVCDVLTGKENPSGKLSDTIAVRYEDYPSSANFGNKEYNNYAEDIFVGYRYFETFAKDKVLYPFGYGLSYTAFEITPLSFEHSDGKLTAKVKVTNVGKASGKEVVELYVEKAKGKLYKEAKSLTAFAKTKLLAQNESEEITLSFDEYGISSYDDSGITGNKSCYVLEKGEYVFYVGNSVKADEVIGVYEVAETKVVKSLSEVCGVEKQNAFSIIKEAGGTVVSTKTVDLKQRILENLPSEILYTGDKGIKLSDVKNKNATLDAFIAQLSDKELSDLTRGEGAMNSPLGVLGNAGAFGGITEELRNKGIPPIIACDGPAGLRIKKYTSLIPCGTALACTWNTELVKGLFERLGEEIKHFKVDVILSPGMNIHRNPLCGRNFEYYSEDPLLCGKIATAATLGAQSTGISVCPKHFACNNQEVNRNYNDSRVSERALREIYLKCFEICVKEGKPKNLMTSYNKINGVWSHYNYDLVTTVLRGEWKYEGNIVTDWWMRMSASPEFPNVENNAYRTRAQVDVLMPGALSPMERKYKYDKKFLKSLGQPDGLTRGELQRAAKNVLNFCLERM